MPYTDYLDPSAFIYTKWVGGCQRDGRVTRAYWVTLRSIRDPIAGGSLLSGHLYRSQKRGMLVHTFHDAYLAVYRPVPEEITEALKRMYSFYEGTSIDIFRHIDGFEPLLCKDDRFGLWILASDEHMAAEYAYNKGYRCAKNDGAVCDWKELEVLCKKRA